MQFSYSAISRTTKKELPSQGKTFSSPLISAHLALIVATMMFSVVVLPDTHVTRPHPAFWRIILGLSFIYGLFMIYLTFLPLQEAREFFKHYDTKLGVDLPEKNYASDC